MTLSTSHQKILSQLDELAAAGSSRSFHHLPGVKASSLQLLEERGLIRTQVSLAAGSSRSFYRTAARITLKGMEALAEARRAETAAALTVPTYRTVTCRRCKGTGLYSWGFCYGCQGTGTVQVEDGGSRPATEEQRAAFTEYQAGIDARERRARERAERREAREAVEAQGLPAGTELQACTECGDGLGLNSRDGLCAPCLRDAQQ